jgi:general secretion pathway protein G
MDRRRARSRGVTPIGAALVVFVFGAGASCLWWAQSASAARDAQSSSRSDAGQIATAASSFRAEHAEGCPTLSQLEEAGFLSRDTRADDAWGDRFRVRCEDDQIVVTSAGPDGVSNNADDIRVSH